MVTELITAVADWMTGNDLGLMALIFFFAQIAAHAKTRQTRKAAGNQLSQPKFRIRQEEGR
jgi:hypothetical protein